MKYSDIKNGMKVRVISHTNGIHQVGTIGTVMDYGTSSEFRVVVGEGEQDNWYEADQVEEVKEKMKAIVKEITCEQGVERGPGNCYPNTEMLKFIGKEIELKKELEYEGWYVQDCEEYAWHWHKNWLHFSKKKEKSMNPKIEKLETDIEATKKSLLKWKINTALLEDGTKEGVKHSASECPLCTLYARRERCAGCPIKERSGKSCCEGTPYEKCTALIHKDKLDEAASQSAQEVYYLTDILIDLRCRLAVEKARIDRPPYHKDFEFIPTYKNTGIAKFVKVCVQSKRSLKDGAGYTETVVIDDVADCQDEDDRYEGPVFYEISMVDSDDESDAITSLPSIKDALNYASKFGVYIADELDKLEGKE